MLKDQPYNLKSDICSLGCVLYEIITLNPPFRAKDMEGLYSKVIKGSYPKIPDKYSTRLSEICSLLIQVHPDNRPTCGNFLLLYLNRRSNSKASIYTQHHGESKSIPL